MSARNGRARPFRRLFHIGALAAFVVWDVLLSSIRISIDILTPRHRMRSGVIAVPIDLEKDLQITLLANLISLTPGTLSLDVSEDRQTIYVHVMHIGGEDVEARRREIKRKLEQPIREIFG